MNKDKLFEKIVEMLAQKEGKKTEISKLLSGVEYFGKCTKSFGEISECKSVEEFGKK